MSSRSGPVLVPDQEIKIVDVVIVIYIVRAKRIGGLRGVWKVRVRAVGFKQGT
jgi:hypothetical protein